MDDSDLLKLENFIDWFAPSKEINEDLQQSLMNIKTKLMILDRIEKTPLHRIKCNSKGIIQYDNIRKGNWTICVKELGDM